MVVFFLVLFAIIIVIVVFYFSFTLKIKVYFTFNEIYISVFLKVIFFKIKFTISRKYIGSIKSFVFNRKESDNNVLKKIGIKKLLKPFFIKNLGFYFDVYDNKLAAVVKFTVVNIVLKRGVFSSE